MLSLRTADDWTTAQITINEGGAQVYTFGADENSCYDAMQALTAWATANFAGTYTWSNANDITTGGSIVTLTGSNAFTLAADAEAQSFLGFAASYGSGTSAVATSAALGTWEPSRALSLGRWQRSLGRGMAGGTGATRPGVPGLASVTPFMDYPASKLEASRLGAMLANTAHPRKGWLYQRHIDGGTWRLCSVGQVSIGAGSTLFPVSIDLRG